MSVTLTAAQQGNLKYVSSLMEEEVPFQLDLSDDQHYQHAIDMHTLAGQTPERNPGLHAALASSRVHYQTRGMPQASTATDASGYQSGGVITAVAPRASNRAGSDGFVSLLGGAPTLYAAMMVNDTQGNWLAGGSASNYNDGSYLPISTVPGTAKPATPSMTSYLQYTYQTQVGGPVIVVNVQKTGNGPLADPVVTQPVQAAGHTSNPYIRIGLGRGSGNTSDVDYWFWQGTSNTTYAVPMVGSVQFNGNMQTLTPGQTFFIQGQLARGAGSGGGYYPIPPASLTTFYNNCQPATPNTLCWQLPAGTTPANSNPLLFGSIPWDTSAVTYLYVQFRVALQGGGFPALAVIQSSDSPDADPLDGTKNIKPIQFVYHCLAEGTGVTMGDGSTRPIETLVTDDVVRTGDGEARVTSTWVAHHRGPVVVLATDGGHDLVMSHNHVVMTTEGPLQAGELREGGSVLTQDGAARITAARQEEFDGLLCNVSVSEPNQPADPARNTLFANGVQVCDFEVQTQYGHARRTDPGVVRAAIDPVFLPDYENWLAEQAPAAAAAAAD